MASTNSATALSQRRWVNHRLIIGLSAAVLLVTLPVLPLTFMGIPGPDISPDILNMAQWSKIFWHQIKPIATAPTTPALKAPSVSQLDEMRLLDTAARQLQDRLLKTPNDPALHNQLGMIYANSGAYDKAALQLQQAIDLSRNRIAAAQENERRARARGDSRAASQAVLELSQLSVELSAGHSALARVYDQLGQHDKVMTELDQLNRDIAFGSTEPAHAVCESTKEGKESAKAGVSHKLSPEVLKMLARAEALMQTGRVQEATQEFLHVTQIDPLCAAPHQRLGLLAFNSGNFYLCVQELQTACQLAPDDASLHNSLAIAYQAQGDGAKAIDQWQKAIALNPKSAQFYYNLGNCQASQGQIKPARQSLAQSAQLDPSVAMVHNNLGTLMSMDGDNKGAIAEFQKALSMQPDLASSHYGLGLALLDCKDYTASIKELKRALTLNPSLLDAHNKIELAYRKAGQPGISGSRTN